MKLGAYLCNNILPPFVAHLAPFFYGAGASFRDFDVENITSDYFLTIHVYLRNNFQDSRHWLYYVILLGVN